MCKQFLVFFFLVAFSFSVYSPSVQAQSTAEALQRIDAIIAQMQTLRAEFAALVGSAATTAPTPSVQGTQAATTLGSDLAYGSTNDDIKKIQKLLATDPSIYPYGVASGFFGPKTQEAIRSFQARFNLDTVGVVGPSTRALLEVFFAAYPDESYPSDVLKKAVPTVAGATVTVSQTPTPQASTQSSNTRALNYIKVQLVDGEGLIEVKYVDGTRKGYIADTDDRQEVIEYITSKIGKSSAEVEAVISFEAERRSSSSSSGGDEDDAEEAIDDADDEIGDVEEAINDAEEDGEDTDWAEDTLDEAIDLLNDAEDAYDDEDFDEAIDLAEEAKDLAKKAADRIDQEAGSEKGDNENIDSIEAEVDEDKSEITIEYEDGSEYVFTVDEDKTDSIIEEVADELDIDEDDVEDLIEFDFGRIASIEAIINEDEGTTLVRVIYTSDVERRVRVNSDDEDDIIKEVSDELDVDEEEVEDIIDFTYA